MTDPENTTRAIELEIEVAGTPEEVWAAIATGPGITAWFVPTTVEGRSGGAIEQSFGPGEEMLVRGHVHAWEPPRRFAYGEHPEPIAGGMAFEFLVEARREGTCVVRLVNSGFGHGQEWDDQYDATEQGWRLFLHILSLHLARFGGRPAQKVQAMAMLPAPDGPDAVWSTLLGSFVLDGDRLVAADDAPAPLAADITLRGDRALVFVVDHPAPGTGLLAAEGGGEALAVSLWLSLYGEEAAAIVARDAPRWQAWAESL